MLVAPRPVRCSASGRPRPTSDIHPAPKHVLTPARACVGRSDRCETVGPCSSGRDLDEPLRGLQVELAVLGEATMPAGAAESALDGPVQATGLEGRIAALDDHKTPAFLARD